MYKYLLFVCKYLLFDSVCIQILTVGVSSFVARNPEDRPRVPINTLAAYTAGGPGASSRYAKPVLDPSKVAPQKQIKLTLKPNLKAGPLRNDDDDSE